MGIFVIIQNIIIICGLVFNVLFGINFIRALKDNKNTCFIGNIFFVLIYAVLLLLFIIYGIFNGFELFDILFIAFIVTGVPMSFTPLTEKGIIKTQPFGYTYISREKCSYEYVQGKFLETLYIYQNGLESGGKEIPMKYHIGIKKPKTVKMLADWYGKHNYENPLTK